MSPATLTRGGHRYSDVPVTPIREAVLDYCARRGYTLSEIAMRCEWIKGDGRPDESRLRRALGISKEGHGGGFREHMRESTAGTIVRAIGMAPVDFDF